MELHFEELLKQITDFMKTEANTDTVVGKQFDLGEFKCVPVIKVGMGFGSGGGDTRTKKEAKGEGIGAGAGVGIEPIGFLVTKGDHISFLEAGKTHGLAALFEKVPDLVEKIVTERSKEKAEV
ncbi:putative spore protein YtfJ [Lutibacter oceani]|uniref:Putative spore protein YtfJ n=1 Tax=Lutibacter oceani TaxID=1853311 RepID=A0A3D9RJH7_9FLAO|nr:spore germination protein GerW family protein [Lutibacter oceani]REE79887.1 putative spore protein YtfJ [Lutibacter oceani]